MPFEERHIFFYLSEIYDILIAERAALKKYINFKLQDFKITEVAHTSKINNQFVEQRDRYKRVMEIPSDQPATLFYGMHRTLMKEKEVGFFITDAVLAGILKDTCINQGISLPRSGERSVVADDLKIGLRIRMADKNMKLEGE